MAREVRRASPPANTCARARARRRKESITRVLTGAVDGGCCGGEDGGCCGILFLLRRLLPREITSAHGPLPLKPGTGGALRHTMTARPRSSCREAMLLTHGLSAHGLWRDSVWTAWPAEAGQHRDAVGIRGGDLAEATNRHLRHDVGKHPLLPSPSAPLSPKSETKHGPSLKTPAGPI